MSSGSIFCGFCASLRSITVRRSKLFTARDSPKAWPFRAGMMSIAAVGAGEKVAYPFSWPTHRSIRYSRHYAILTQPPLTSLKAELISRLIAAGGTRIHSGFRTPSAEPRITVSPALLGIFVLSVLPVMNHTRQQATVNRAAQIKLIHCHKP